MKQWVPSFIFIHLIAPTEKDSMAFLLESQDFVTLWFICTQPQRLDCDYFQEKFSILYPEALFSILLGSIKSLGSHTW